MEKATYILKHYGEPVAVVTSTSYKQLKEKLKQAIQTEVDADKEGHFSVIDKGLPDWGETVDLHTQYVHDGLMIDDLEFSLMKCLSY